MTWLGQLLKWEAQNAQRQPVQPVLPMPSTPQKPVQANIMPQKVYAAAKRCLGQHLTLNSSVPEDVGCAEAVSKVLEEAGYILPPSGIPNVNGLIDWMLKEGFVEHTSASIGDVITAHNPDLANPNYAHTGIVLEYGIASNDSSNGRFNENYSVDSWVRSFAIHKSVTRYFTPV